MVQVKIKIINLICQTSIRPNQPSQDNRLKNKQKTDLIKSQEQNIKTSKQNMNII